MQRLPFCNCFTNIFNFQNTKYFFISIQIMVMLFSLQIFITIFYLGFPRPLQLSSGPVTIGLIFCSCSVASFLLETDKTSRNMNFHRLEKSEQEMRSLFEDRGFQVLGFKFFQSVYDFLSSSTEFYWVILPNFRFDE